MRLDRLSAVATAGLAVATLAGCGAATSTATPQVPDPGTSAEALGTSGPTPSASSSIEPPSSTATAGSSTGTGSAAPTERLDCSTIESVWPTSADRPSPSGWRGPDCQATASELVLTWTYAGGDPAPEVTDAAFVALQKNFRSAGWVVDESDGSDKAGEVVATSRVHSAEGRDGVITYVAGGSNPASLVVSFAT